MVPAKRVSKRVTLEEQVSVITENYRALDVGLVWRPEQEIILVNNNKNQNYSEVTPVSTQTVREYLILIWVQYQVASKKLKSELLDEVVKNTDMHRGSVKRIMSRVSEPEFKRGKGVSVNAYRDEAKRLLKHLWKDMGHMGAKRMKGAIPGWIGKWDHPEADGFICTELEAMSASTIERTLKEEKSKLRRQLNTGTKSNGGNKMKTIIPIRELGVKPTVPGHCEIDCVAHCGGSLSGEHIWTLTLTDILTGHTENEALQFKNGFEVMQALHRIEERLPFKIIALYMDNGSEFLNEDVHKRFSLKKNQITREQVIELFRSRPYKKNDQCYVEQKNYTHVRELFGYDRYRGELMVKLMNNIYRKEWRLLSNFFHPQIRLKSKVRHGAKIKKTFFAPATPFENLKPFLSPEKLSELSTQQEKLNPFDLRKKLKRKLRDFQAYNSNPGDHAVSKHAI